MPRLPRASDRGECDHQGRARDVATASETHEEDSLLGSTLAHGKYEVMSLIAAGAMGKVYRARQLPLGREVALKVLHDRYQDDAAFAEAFAQEARAASLIRHHNTVQLLDFGRDEQDRYFIAMELVDGSALHAWLADTPVPPVRWTVEVMSQVLAALAAAHDAQVVHRDVKPENILIVTTTGDDGRPLDLVKVCDFGIAKIRAAGDARAEHEAPHANMVCGTPEYMSPEQAGGQPLDARSDIYACGVLLFQMTTGRLPFEAPCPLETARKHIHESSPRPSDWVAEVDPRLESIIVRAMQKDPAARFETAREMRAALLVLLPSSVPEVAPAGDQRSEPDSGGGLEPRSVGALASARAAAVLARSSDQAREARVPLKLLLSGGWLLFVLGSLGPVWEPFWTTRWMGPPVEPPSGAEYSTYGAVTRIDPADAGEEASPPPSSHEPDAGTADPSRHAVEQAPRPLNAPRARASAQRRAAAAHVAARATPPDRAAAGPPESSEPRLRERPDSGSQDGATGVHLVEEWPKPAPATPSQARSGSTNAAAKSPDAAPANWSHVPHVAVEYVQVQGGLTVSSVRQAAWERLGAFRACYEQATERLGSRIPTWVELRLRVKGSGAVAAAHARRTALPGLVECVGEAAQRLLQTTGPGQEGGEALVVIRFR
jgi:serine/threonine protein kinase